LGRLASIVRRSIVSLVLSLLLVLAQQAALVHQIGHGLGHGAGGGPAVAAAQGSGSVPADNGDYCEKCFQYAHVTSAAPEAVLAALLPVAQDESAGSRAAAELAAEAPQFRSRDPPAVL
jgi:hypothetical protein